MNEIAATLLPCMLLFVVVAGYLLTVFEPYYAYRRRGIDAVELLDYHAQDPKVRIIAEWWAAQLVEPASRWYEEDNVTARLLKGKLMDALIRHRFIFGDDPRELEFGTSVSPLLKRALKDASLPVPQAATHRVMKVRPKIVSISDGEVIWRGRPAEYKSRFCDFYPEP